MLDVDDGRVSPLDRLSQELGQLLLFPPTCCLAGGHPNFHLLGFRASPKFPPFQTVNESCSFLVFLSLLGKGFIKRAASPQGLKVPIQNLKVSGKRFVVGSAFQTCRNS